MAGKQDLVVKMTINSKDFEKGLQSAKKDMNGFSNKVKEAGSSIKESIGKIGGYVAVAVGAFKTLQQAFSTTEQGVDTFGKVLQEGKSQWNAFMESLNRGDLSGFLSNIDTIIDAADDLYDAMDRIGSFKSQSRVAYAKLNARKAAYEAELRDQDTSPERRKELLGLIKETNEEIKKLNKTGGGLSGSAMMAMMNEKLSNAGSGYRIYNSQEAKDWVDKYTSQGFDLKDYYNRYQWEIENGPDDNAYKRNYEIMKILGPLSESGFWDKLIGLYVEAINEETANADIDRAFNLEARRYGKTAGSGKVGGSSSGPKMSEADQIKFINRGAMWGSLLEQGLADYVPFIEEEDIIEPETDAVIQQYIDSLNEVNLTGEQTAMMFNSMADAVGSLNGLLADDSPMKAFVTSAQAVMNAAGSMIQTYTMLSGAAAAAGAMESGESLPWPYNLIAIASYAATAIGTLATIKNAFAGSFASGGIVGGNSYSGDKLYARVNSGEMILNRQQQNALFGGGNVRFVIEGSQLKGVLDNYSKTTSL